MSVGKWAILLGVFTVAAISGWSSPGYAVILPACNDTICAWDGDVNVINFGISGTKVPSSPGQIQDGVVVYTGTNSVPATTNFAGMDDAYAAVTGACPPNCSFSSLTAGDPGGAGQFAGDAATTWDSTLAAFLGFLAGDSPVFFLNQNESNPGAPPTTNCVSLGPLTGVTDGQDMCIYAQVILKNSVTGATTVFELEAPTRLFSQGPVPGGTDGVKTAGEDLVAKGDTCLNAANQQVLCSDPTATQGPFNNNLGADLAAYGGIIPGLNTLLAACATFGILTVQCPYDTLSIRFDLDDLTNGFEQLFILTTTQVIELPEPASLILLGSGLAGLGAAAWRRRHRRA